MNVVIGDSGEFIAERPEIVVHVCCAPCLANFLAFFENSFIIRPFWYNPNIHGVKEYRRRKDSFIRLCQKHGLKPIIDDTYSVKDFLKKTMTAEQRCRICYNMRLEKTAEYARENHIDIYTSTLLSSTRQGFSALLRSGREIAEKNAVAFLEYDIRPDYREKILKKAGLYTQAYCGCIFSEQERYLG
jgi:hypothetical protein